MQAEDLLARPFATLTDLLSLHAAARPDHPAVRQDDRVVRYRELAELADRIAAAVRREGIAPREIVAVCARMSIEYVAVFLGILRAGAAAAPLSPSATGESLAAMIADAGARLLFLDAEAAEILAGAKTPGEVARVSLDGSEAGRPLLDWIGQDADASPIVEIAPDWPFNVIYSSGTTGTPKGIVQTHGMRWAHVQRGVDMGPDPVTLVSTPLYSNTTLVVALPTLAIGGTLVLLAKFDVTTFLELAQAWRVTHAMLVPVQYQRLMAHPRFDSFDLSNFRMKFATSAPFSAHLKADVLARWPGGLTEYYGMTEGGGTCVLLAHLHPDKLHTVGRPAPGHDIRIIDEDGAEIGPGAVGEVVGRSNAMMTGYHNQPGKTAETEWRDASGHRFFRTGDIGRFDADGFLTLLDRGKDLIISGGFNVYPSDLEAVIAVHPDVAEVAVIGAPSERWGETPVAVAALRPNARVSAEALRDWANERLGKSQRVTAVAFIDELPRSAIGKVLKRDLRDQFGRLGNG